ncbi:hypothetical protein ASE57_07525 [Sphingomonas sp. Leaf11]|nr:hypothetical protein ASE58_07530 [Sphingomonas sp. Leaf9]KQM44483.1 hypothetical protein ASE57_07525 [Sphingomonas sp. Leaf11]
MQHGGVIWRVPVDGGVKPDDRCRDGHAFAGANPMTIRFLALAATAAACLSSAAHAELREPVTARVSVAGLDLASSEGRRLLDARIDAAAQRGCQSQLTGLRRVTDERRCREEMHRDAQVRIAQLTPVEVASAK